MSKHVTKFEDLIQIEPITANQEKAFNAWSEGENLVLAGSAGTGKTFIAMYLALQTSLEPSTPYHKVIIIRSVVPTRDIGYLPGTKEEKLEPYESPYKNICLEFFDYEPSSYNSFVIVDEMQNLNFHELDSVITRIGQNCRVIFSGDYYQSDFREGYERDGIQRFLRIGERLKNFSVITFGWDDIVRSDFLRDYIMTKEMLGIK